MFGFLDGHHPLGGTLRGTSTEILRGDVSSNGLAAKYLHEKANVLSIERVARDMQRQRLGTGEVYFRM